MDSRRVRPGDLFLACQGGGGHGLDHLDAALMRGAVAVLADPGGFWPVERVVARASALDIPMIALPGLGARVSEIAGRFFGDPSRDLEIIGFTGTNGKTSCTHFLAQALGSEGSCAIVGTLGTGFPGRLSPSSHTTPDPVSVQARLAELYAAGAKAVAMEVSSHALDQGRINAVRVDGAVLTNLSHDHLDYHGAMAAYAAAKRKLFEQPGLRYAVLNHDDSFGREILPELPAGVEPVLYGTGELPPLPRAARHWAWASRIEPRDEGLVLELQTSRGSGELRSGLLGRFNASNLLAVLGVLLFRGWPLGHALSELEKVGGVPGRMERFGGSGLPTVVVDYAHTPDALGKVLETLREHCRGRILCVFGCGGDRDRAKRPLMGRAAAAHSDRIWITDDNPRTEDGDRIVADILVGLEDSSTGVEVERDRAKAISRAIGFAAPDDWILVAGKGHETYQRYAERDIEFDDREQVRRELRGLALGVAR